jgi:hypothetical protein
MVLENDRDLLVSRIAASESQLNVNGAKGYYDPVFGLNAYRLRSVTPVASLIGGAGKTRAVARVETNFGGRLVQRCQDRGLRAARQNVTRHGHLPLARNAVDG